MLENFTFQLQKELPKWKRLGTMTGFLKNVESKAPLPLVALCSNCKNKLISENFRTSYNLKIVTRPHRTLIAYIEYEIAEVLPTFF